MNLMSKYCPDSSSGATFALAGSAWSLPNPPPWHFSASAMQGFPLAAAALAALPVRFCVIDREAIACDQSGLAVFDLIRHHRDATE